jgi:predicted amidohydrolase YtcJ
VLAGMTADRTVVLHGGVVRTMDPARPVGAGVVVAGDRVAGVLGPREALPAGQRVALEGACVVPGFTDSHVHFPSWALGRRELRLFGARSLAEAVDAVAAEVTRTPRNAWLRGRGWRSELWPGGDVPSRQALDPVTGDVPVALRAHDGHSLWLNSAALARAGGDLRVPGGVVEVDAGGEPTGVLREESAWAFEAAHAQATREEALAAMREALPVAAAAGVVAVHDKDGGRGAPEYFAALRGRGELTLRVWQSLPAESFEEQLAGAPPPDPWLRVGYVKAFMDGTLGSRTARLLDGSGVQITSPDELADIARRAAGHEMPVAVHAIGDLANREALDGLEASAGDWQPRGLRPRIEHAQCVHPDDISRFASLGVAASVQFTHATSDRDLVERLWTERADHAYPFRSLLDAGVRVAEGSDAPVEELDPLAGLRAAVLRTADERPPWRPEQGVSPEEWLDASTVTPAWLAGDEGWRGRLRPGFAADLVVLSSDPVSCAPGELARVEVLATMAGGRWTHSTLGSSP